MSVFSPKRFDKDLTGNITPELIKSDRATMVEKGDDLMLTKSLVDYGFDEYNPEEAIKLIERTALGFDDVRLFPNIGTFRNVFNKYNDVLNKEVQGAKLNEEEIKIRDEYNSLGIYNFETLNMFGDSQNVFFSSGL